MDLRLQIKVPETLISSSSAELVYSDPQFLQAWLDELDFSDVATTVNKLFVSLETFIHSDIEVNLRLRLLELYHHVVDEIFYHYDEVTIEILPLDKKHRLQLREKILALYLLLAGGYKIIVKYAHQNDMRLKRQPKMLQSVYRSMELLMYALLYVYRSHQSPPKLTFLELHQLYHYAQVEGVVDVKVKGIRSHLLKPTINALYKQIMLLALSDPYQISAEHIMTMHIFLIHFSEHCQLLENAQCGQPEGKYLIDITADKPPTYCGAVNIQDGLSVQKIFDVWPAINLLSAELSKDQAKGISELQRFGKDKIQRLVLQLTGKRRGDHKRQHIHKKIQLVAGFDAVVDYLAALQSQTSTGSTAESQQLLSDWSMRDQDERGLMLYAEKILPDAGLKIGEVVGFTELAKSRLTLAVIRWVRHYADNIVQIGVELIPGKVALVNCQENASSYAYPSLYLPPSEDNQFQASLVVEKTLLDDTNTLEVSGGGMEFTVHRLRNLLEMPNYIQFEFNAVQKQ